MTKLLLLACPGCSMGRPIMTFVNPSHYWYAWGIVLLAAGIVPLLAGGKIMLIGRRIRRHSTLQKIILAIGLTIFYGMAYGSHSFGSLIVFWLFLPLNILLVVLITVFWNYQGVAFFAILATVLLYMYWSIKLLFAFDRKIWWRWSRKGRRLIRRQKALLQNLKLDNTLK